MLVSDLDGTMVGDDAKTAAFSEVWHDRTSFPPGSVLVYSTGRSLQSFMELVTEKKDVMAIPDALICAVGTKIYKRLDTTTEKRNLIESTLGGLIRRDAPNNNNNSELGNWVEDYDWTESLDKGWNFQNVFDAALVAVDLVGGDNAHLRPPDEFTEHKITLGVRDEFVDDVLEYMTTACAMHDLNPKLITSGTGGWQYLDVVSNQGGKLESLEYVRTAFGVEGTAVGGFPNPTHLRLPLLFEYATAVTFTGVLAATTYITNALFYL